MNDIYQIDFNYLVMNDVMRLIKEDKLTVLSQDFDNDCKIKLEIRKANLNAVLQKLDKIEQLKTTYLYTA